MTERAGFLNRYVVPPLTALSENTYMSSIRAGMVAVVPLTIIGGLFTIATYFPVAAWEKLVKPYVSLLQVPVTATFGLLGVFVCFAIGYDLGKRLKQEAVVSASMATLVFLLIQLQIQGPPTFSVAALGDATGLAAKLASGSDAMSRYVAAHLREDTRRRLAQELEKPGKPSRATVGMLAADLNALVTGPLLSEELRLAAAPLSRETLDLLQSRPEDAAVAVANRLLLQDAFPEALPRMERRDQEISMAGLGSRGLFTAILVALVCVRVQQWFTEKNLVIRLPPNVPPVVYESFLSLVPMCVLVGLFWGLRFVLGIDINDLIQNAFKPLLFALNTLPGILVYAFLVTLLWSVGINGDNAMDAIVGPIFLQFIAANVEATTLGQPLPYVTALGFFTTFVNVGGTGATIALALILWTSKEPGFRKVSRLSLPTQVFQINEPIFFGLPIVLNPVFMAPYILNALILTTGTYLLMYSGVIQKPFVNVPWTTPPIIGHYLVSGGDWKAAVWGALSIVIAMLVYWPFAKVAERQRLQAEAAGTAHE